MLAATILLHGVTRRLFGRSPAAFAAALFCSLGSTQYLGAFATYDALALMLLATATWLGVVAAGRSRAPACTLLALAGLVLLLADATKYAAALFDPVVLLVIVCAYWRRHGPRAGGLAGVLTLAVLALSLAGALRAGGAAYWHGISLTTLARPDGTSPSLAVFMVSLGWAGAVGALSLIGVAVVIGMREPAACRTLAVSLAAAVWLAPAEQARISTFTSLFKHVGFGEWFGAMLAGVALAALSSAIPRAKAEGACRLSWAACAASGCLGIMLASGQFASWPDIAPVVAMLRPLVTRAPVLAADDDNVISYYLDSGGRGAREYAIGANSQWRAAFTGDGFSYRNPATGRAVTGQRAYQLAIRHGMFGVIALSGYPAWRYADDVIRGDVRRYGSYRLAASIPYATSGARHVYQLWVRRGAR